MTVTNITCDLCKSNPGTGDLTMEDLTSVDSNYEFMEWDVCKTCTDKLTKLIDSGYFAKDGSK